MLKVKIIIASLVYLSCLSCNVLAQEKQKAFVDTLDSAFDISNYLLNLHGLMPIAVPITEPAVGYGAVGAALYFIPKQDSVFVMPDIVAGAGGYTQNGTWFAGGGYIGFWNEDKIRYRGVFGYGDINLTYYDSGPVASTENVVNFNIDSYFFLQQAVFRISESNFFLGGKYQLTKTEVLAYDESFTPNIDPRDIETWNSGIALITEFENFNNVLSPTKGYRVNLTYDQNLEFLGSDRNFGRLTFFSHSYFHVNDFWIPAFRVESLLATGRPAFYAYPFISLRGVPKLRYQGELTALIETEHAFNISSRWGLVGFAGMGVAFKTLEDTDQKQTAWNLGTGFRYKIARLLGLNMGLDVAKGPEDWAVYVVFGSAWLK